MSEDKRLFYFDYVTQKDIDRKRKEIVSNIKEEDKSIFLFEGECFYSVGRGHCFGKGFYNEYATKKGLFATQCVSGLWVIDDEDYDYKDSVFVKKPKMDVSNVDFSNVDLTFPVVKNVNARAIGEDIKPVKPKTRP